MYGLTGLFDLSAACARARRDPQMNIGNAKTPSDKGQASGLSPNLFCDNTSTPLKISMMITYISK
jgi:hypothetical protein